MTVPVDGSEYPLYSLVEWSAIDIQLMRPSMPLEACEAFLRRYVNDIKSDLLGRSVGVIETYLQQNERERQMDLYENGFYGTN